VDAATEAAAEHAAARTMETRFENTGHAAAKAPVTAEVFLLVTAVSIAPATASADPAQTA